MFRKAAGIQEQRDGIGMDQLRHVPNIVHGDRLPAARIVGYCEVHDGDVRVGCRQLLLQPGEVDVAFAGGGVVLLRQFRRTQVGGQHAVDFNVGLRHIKCPLLGIMSPCPSRPRAEHSASSADLPWWKMKALRGPDRLSKRASPKISRIWSRRRKYPQFEP